MRCRDVLTKLAANVDSEGVYMHVSAGKTGSQTRVNANNLIPIANATEMAPSMNTLSPFSEWAWQFMDPSLFSSEASLSLAPAMSDEAVSLPFPGYFTPNGVIPQ